VGIGAAAFGAALTPIVVPVGLRVIGFGAAGPVTGKPRPRSASFVKSNDLFRIHHSLGYKLVSGM